MSILYCWNGTHNKIQFYGSELKTAAEEESRRFDKGKTEVKEAE
jgi:CDGSH-type Zn-finger protein